MRQTQARAAATADGTSTQAAEGGAASTAASDAVKQQFGKVQNGADIRGVVLEGVEGESVSLTLLMVFYIARAFVSQLAEQKDIAEEAVTVALGTDSRLSGLAIRASFEAGAASRGATVLDCHLATTPAMFFATIAPGHEYTGGVMVTASHLPWNRNGMKFFTSAGGLNKHNIKGMLERASAECAAAGQAPLDRVHDPGFVVAAARASPPHLVREINFMDVYAASLRDEIIDGVQHPEHRAEPLAGMKILVDAGNGAGGFFARAVLAPLGADTAGSQFLDPDGTFPNHVPNPEDAAAMSATIDAVLAHGADLGVVFDTDVDRSGIVDKQGRAVNKNKLIALMAAVTLRKAPGTTVVTDSVTSQHLTAFIESLGGTHLRYMRGYKNVIDKGIELNGAGEACELMMETSGHGALRANHFLDDGAFMAVQIIIEAARRRHQGEPGVSDVLNTLEEPAESAELRLKIKASDFKPVADSTLAAFTQWVGDGAGGHGWQADEPNHEGVRVKVLGGEGGAQTGWALLRASLHDPFLVLNAESDRKGGVGEIMRAVRKFMVDTQVQTCDTDTGSCVNECVDISKLNEYA